MSTLKQWSSFEHWLIANLSELVNVWGKTMTYTYTVHKRFNFRATCTAFDNCLNYWIGLRNVNSVCMNLNTWMWIDDSPMSYNLMFWGIGYPSGWHRCGSLRVLSDPIDMQGFWIDKDCDFPLRYICKKGIDCNNSLNSHGKHKKYRLRLIISPECMYKWMFVAANCPEYFIITRGSQETTFRDTDSATPVFSSYIAKLYVRSWFLRYILFVVVRIITFWWSSAYRKFAKV